MYSSVLYILSLPYKHYYCISKFSGIEYLQIWSDLKRSRTSASSATNASRRTAASEIPQRTRAASHSMSASKATATEAEAAGTASTIARRPNVEPAAR